MERPQSLTHHQHRFPLYMYIIDSILLIYYHAAWGNPRVSALQQGWGSQKQLSPKFYWDQCGNYTAHIVNLSQTHT